MVLSVTLTAPLSAAERLELRFGDQLGLSDIRLAGPRASRSIAFACDPDWKIQPGAELRLRLEHAPKLDGERSFLALKLNHGVLRSFRLDARNQGPVDVVVPLPPSMLQADNQLVVAVEQSTPGAADPSWTLVRATSSLVIPYEPQRRDHGLAELPEPLLPRRSYEPRRLAVLLPVAPSLETLEATARTVANLVGRVAPAPVGLVFVRSLRDVDAPALAVGTPQEQPELQAVGIRAPLRIVKGEQGAALTAEGKPLDPSTGLVLLAPSAGPRAQPLLVVSGPSPAAVRRAAGGLFRVHRRPEDRLLLVADDLPPSARRPREWEGFLPPRDRFSLAEAGDPHAERAVTSDGPARVRLRATPDARFLPYGHRVSLDFSVLPALREDPDAMLDVSWNGTLLRREPIAGHVGQKAFSLSIAIPAALLAGDNLLTVAWKGRSGADGPFVMLEGDSDLYLPREYVSQLPDLALLRESLFPFSLRPDLAGTIVVPPAEEGDEAVALLCELAAFLGRMLPATEFAFRVQPAAEVARARPAANLVVLETGGGASPFALPDWKRLPRGEALARVPLLQELASPWSEDHYVLRVRARSPALLRAALRSLGQSATLARLSGDTAFLAAEGPLSMRLAAQRIRAEVSYLTRLEAWLRANWLALPLILALVSGLLFLGLRLALGHYRALRGGRPGTSGA